jgi:hypothetical protein
LPTSWALSQRRSHAAESLSKSDNLKHLESSVLLLKRSAQKLENITKCLSRFSGRGPIAPRAFAVAPVLSDLEPMLTRAINPSIKLAIHCADDLPDVYGDVTEFENIICAFVGRANDVMPTGGSMSLRASHRTCTSQPVVCLEITLATRPQSAV